MRKTLLLEKQTDRKQRPKDNPMGIWNRSLVSSFPHTSTFTLSSPNIGSNMVFQPPTSSILQFYYKSSSL
ncbi:5582_t:CDS:2 [Acaulospora morrowiae]|uniref:5582_t:CDS:1 n=1 Tax=Acaulospora morrowiae TaxID=94023 RepID=A0A9N8YY92_9GLOM|nr:5582_t:CDS:2 [Acaulospora morrowiae]